MKTKMYTKKANDRERHPGELSLEDNLNIWFHLVCVCVCVWSYVGLLPASLQQFVVVVLSHGRVHIQELGRGVLQHGEGLGGVAFIQGLVDLSDGGDTWTDTTHARTHIHTNTSFSSLL